MMWGKAGQIYSVYIIVTSSVLILEGEQWFTGNGSNLDVKKGNC